MASALKPGEKVETKYHGQIFRDGTNEEIPFDEVVIFRSRDNAFPQALEAYIVACQRVGAPGPHIASARMLLHRVQDWREQNKELCRIPGSQHEYSIREIEDARFLNTVYDDTTTHNCASVTLHTVDKRVAATILLTQQVTKTGDSYVGGVTGLRIQCEALGLDLKLTEPRPRHVPLINNAREMLVWHLPHEKAAIDHSLDKILESVCADTPAGSCANG
jgi:hypothetical protein